MEPEQPYESYGQLIINVKQFRKIDNLVSELEPWVTENFPEAQIPIRKFGVGPSNTWKFDVRITGPGDADPGVLRVLAAKVTAILDDAPLAGLYRTDWRQRVQKVVPMYSEERVRWAGVSREDIASATKQAFDGRVVGLYREGDDLTPIVMRQIEEERQAKTKQDTLISRYEWVPTNQRRKPTKISVGSPQFPDAVKSTQRSDSGVVSLSSGDSPYLESPA